MWLGVGALLAEFSGWPELAREFPAGSRPAGKRIRGQVVKVGVVGENGVTGIVLTPAGLYLDTMFLFRFRRPPVLVPWTFVRHSSDGQFLWYRWHEFDLAGVTTLSVRPAAYEAIVRYRSADTVHSMPNERGR